MNILYKGNICVDLYVADLETTVDEDVKKQTETEVWAAGYASLLDDEFKPCINNSFSRFFNRLRRESNRNKVVWFHNLAFDGSFIVDYLLRSKYIQAYDIFWDKDKDMSPKSFKCLIDGSGTWYSITVKTKDNQLIEFRDSNKLLRYSIDKLGKELNIPKLTIEYIKNRASGNNLSREDQRYLKRDIEILWRFMREFVIEQGNYGITIGTCCLSKYNKLYSIEERSMWYPNITKMNLDGYFRKAYKGGLCYINKSNLNKTFVNGYTLDINSLYPYIIGSKLRFPVGKPNYFEGEPSEYIKNHKYRVYFTHFKCSFYLKEGRLPMIQVKNDSRYNESEFLETSDVYDENIGDYVSYDENGDRIRVELTLTDVDYQMFLQTYDIEDVEYIDGYWFYTETGETLFGRYVSQFKEMKESSIGVKRVISKMFLNYLIGKFGTNPLKSNLVPVLNSKQEVVFDRDDYEDNGFNYIPIPCFVNAYGRAILLNAIYKNYDNFIYCDTDSLHMIGDIKDAKGINFDNSEFGCWKIERYWKEARFFKRKCYIEYGIEKSDQKEFEYYIKISGMANRAKQLLAANLKSEKIEVKDEVEEKFMSRKLTLSTIEKGLCVPGNLYPRRIKGGIVLLPDEYIF